MSILISKVPSPGRGMKVLFCMLRGDCERVVSVSLFNST